MIQNISIFARVKKVIVEWEQPHMLPKEYSIVYTCRQEGESKISTRRCRTIPPKQTRAVLGKILPGSRCTVTFKANYGHARNDLGITQTVIVPYASKENILYILTAVFVCACACVCVCVPCMRACVREWQRRGVMTRVGVEELYNAPINVEPHFPPHGQGGGRDGDLTLLMFKFSTYWA